MTRSFFLAYKHDTFFRSESKNVFELEGINSLFLKFLNKVSLSLVKLMSRVGSEICLQSPEVVWRSDVLNTEL